MPHLNKYASVRAKNIKHLTQILKNTGRNIDGASAAEAVKNIYSKGGSGSLVYDLASGLPKKILRFGGKKVPVNSVTKKNMFGKTKYKTEFKRVNTVGDKIKRGLDKALDTYQRKATDIDIKAGNFVADKLKDKKISKAFIEKKHFTVNGVGNEADKIMQVEIPKLTEPISKATNKALPLIGAYTVSTKLDELARKKRNQNSEGGEAMKKNASKEDLIDKIASAVSEKNIQIVIKNPDKLEKQYKKLASLANKATEMLKVAQVNSQHDKEEIQKLAAENKKLKLQIIAKNRSDRAIKLANTMYQKRLIKKADIDSKIDEIMDMNDQAYEVLAETVENITVKTASYEEGVDSLEFISDNSGSTKLRKTLADEIDSLANGY